MRKICWKENDSTEHVNDEAGQGKDAAGQGKYAVRTRRIYCRTRNRCCRARKICYWTSVWWTGVQRSKINISPWWDKG